MSSSAINPSIPPSRLRIYLIAFSVAFVVALVTAGFAIWRFNGDQEVRYEVESKNNMATMITWAVDSGEGLAKAPTSLGETVSIPWSTTVTFKNRGKRLSLAVDLAGSGDATCRIFVDDKKIAESTNAAGVLCEALLP
ncbi:hypothetical protein [Actinoplanes sp. NPDC020271]|uniref:hypothetical protein n=1 Tax=Actinoplanes sp. NPDC020271 TaxID=3363896 RepID=UPI003797FFB2